MERSGNGNHFNDPKVLCILLASAAFLVIVMVVSVGVSSQGLSDEKARELIEEAEHLRISMEYDAALEILDDVIRRRPEYAEAYINRGLVYKRLERFDSAIDDFTRAIEIDPTNACTYTARGDAYAGLGDHGSAIDDYLEASRLDEQYESIIWDKATHYNREGQQYETAIIYLDKASEIYRDSPLTFAAYGWAYGHLGQHDKALKYFSMAFDQEPECDWAYTNAGSWYYWMGIIYIDIRDCNEAIEQGQADYWTFLKRGRAYVELYEDEIALDDYNHAIELDPYNAEGYFYRGNAYFHLGRHDEALADYTRVIELDPGYSKAYCNRASVYAELGQWENCLAECNKTIELDPYDTLVYYNRGFAYKMLGQTENAIEDFKKALEIDPCLEEAENELRDMGVPGY